MLGRLQTAIAAIVAVVVVVRASATTSSTGSVSAIASAISAATVHQRVCGGQRRNGYGIGRRRGRRR